MFVYTLLAATLCLPFATGKEAGSSSSAPLELDLSIPVQEQRGFASLAPGFASANPLDYRSIRGGRLSLSAKPKGFTVKDGFLRRFRKFVRASEVFARAANIYGSYKATQVVAALHGRERRDRMYDKVHEQNSKRMLQLCLDMRGFFVKAGQFLSTRQDFMPEVYCRRLSQLCDDVPPMNRTQVEQILTEELIKCTGNTGDENSQGQVRDRHWKDAFEHVDFDKPLGSASIAQVHYGRLKGSKRDVAIKLQNPKARELMLLDLECLKAIAMFLRKSGEIKFDLVNAVAELKKQITNELDFRTEAESLSRGRQLLLGKIKGVQIPEVIPELVTERMVAMSMLKGTPLSALANTAKFGEKGSDAPQHIDRKTLRTFRMLQKNPQAKRLLGEQIVGRMSEAWGLMVMCDNFFHADPHPGNIFLIRKDEVPSGIWKWMGPLSGPLKWLFGSRSQTVSDSFDLGIIDWGQVKKIDNDFKDKLTNLLVSVASANHPAIAKDFIKLGIKVGNTSDLETTAQLARTMFDTKTYEGDVTNLFDDKCALNKNEVQSLPQDMFFILRTIQMIRGLGIRLGVTDYSLTERWADIGTHGEFSRKYRNVSYDNIR